MSDYVSNITLPDLVERINAASRVLITTHTKPDGDAYGSVSALTAALRLHKPDATIEGWLMPPVPAAFKLLSGWPFVQEYDPQNENKLGEPDLILVLDTGAVPQVAPMMPFLESRLDRTIIIDHHISGDLPATHRYIDSSAAACCTVIADVLDAVTGTNATDVPCDVSFIGASEPNALIADGVVAESLFVGIASDTGWFRFSNTTARTHRVAARMIQNGVDHADMYARLEQQERPAKLALQIRAMTSMQLLADSQVAIMTLHAADFTETGALPEETERFVDIPQSVSTVKMVVLLVENPPTAKQPSPPIRVSLRSKPGPDAVNVAEFAQPFGGGGHARAAGAKVHGSIDEVSEKIKAAIAKAFE